MTTTTGPTSASEVVEADLAHLRDVLASEMERLSGGRLLITGGAGFLGYYLVQAPLAWNDAGLGAPVDVVVYENYWRGVPDWLTRLADRPDLTLVEHDLRGSLPPDPGRFDWVIHAAGIASPTYYRRHPIETMDTNINGLRALLDLAESQAGAGHPLSGFLFFSSSEIYGDPEPDAIPTPETYRGNVSCTGPRACYDESKRYGETLCVNFAHDRGVPTRMARPFNNYGPGMKITDGRVIADFSRAIIEDRDIVLYSDGSPTRTFCYVADAVAGYYKVLVRGRDGEPYNIGAEQPEISMADFAKEMQRLGAGLFGYRGSVVLGRSSEEDYLVDNPSRRRPDIAKARSELGYEPAHSLEQGLRQTLLWYREHSGGEER